MYSCDLDAYRVRRTFHAIQDLMRGSTWEEGSAPELGESSVQHPHCVSLGDSFISLSLCLQLASGDRVLVLGFLGGLECRDLEEQILKVFIVIKAEGSSQLLVFLISLWDSASPALGTQVRESQRSRHILIVRGPWPGMLDSSTVIHLT